MTVDSDRVDDWEEFWGEYIEENSLEREVENIVKQYPEFRSLTVSRTEIGDLGYDIESIHDHPDEMLDTAVAGFERYVEKNYPDKNNLSFDNLKIHVMKTAELRWNTSENVEENLNNMVRLDGKIKKIHDDKTHLINATYVCPAGHTTNIKPLRNQRRSINTCGESGCQNGVYFEPNRSHYAKRQKITVEDEELGEIDGWVEGIDRRRLDRLDNDTIKGCAILRAAFDDRSTEFESYLDVHFVASRDGAH